MFEVQDLKYATLATVSRCGMIWFSEEVLTTQTIFENYLATLRNVPFDEQEREQQLRNQGDTTTSMGLRAQRECADVIAPFFEPGGLVIRVLENAGTRPHIMDFTRLRVLTAMFSLVNKVSHRCPLLSFTLSSNDLKANFLCSSSLPFPLPFLIQNPMKNE
jgi:dynein heavy chain 1